MKKAKVARIIEQEKSKAYAQGVSAERARQRESEIRRQPITRDGLIQLNEQPRERYRHVVLPVGYVARGADVALLRPCAFGDPRQSFEIRFEARVFNVSFENGLRIEWYGWKPLGPYPVNEPVRIDR